MQSPELTNIFPGAPKFVPKIEIDYKPTINDELIKTLDSAHQNFLDSVKQIGIEKLIVGLSGGVDSAVAASLLKSSGVDAHAVIVEVDNENTLSKETEFAITLAKKIGLPYEVINASRVYKEHLNLFPTNSLLTRVHLRSRSINNILLQFADRHNGFLIDTTDKSEDILKIYEESFHGHFAPVISFYKSEMYDLADYFNLCELRQCKSGCPELSDFDSFGMQWEDLDPILYSITELKMSFEDIATTYGVDQNWLKQLERRMTTQHLRTEPTIFNVPRPKN